MRGMPIKTRDWEATKAKVVAIAQAAYTRATSKKCEVYVHVVHEGTDHEISVSFPLSAFSSEKEAYSEVVSPMSDDIAIEMNLFPHYPVETDDTIGYSFSWDDEIEGKCGDGPKFKRDGPDERAKRTRAD